MPGDAIASLIRQAAKRVHRKHPERIEVADLMQVGEIWAMENQRSIDLMLENYSGRLRIQLMRAMEKVAIEAKDMGTGFQERDADWYRIAVVELGLTDLMNRPGYMERPEGEWAQILTEVKRAWKAAALTPGTQRLLAQRYGVPMSWDYMAEFNGSSARTIGRRVYAGLKAVADELELDDFFQEHGLVIKAPIVGRFGEFS